MVRITRKVWAGIGAATLIGTHAPASLAQHSMPGMKSEAPDTKAGGKADDKAATTPAQGGEAYLTDGGPRDTRVRYYRDIALMRGHIRVGEELIAEGRWDDAMPHFLHPTEELYVKIEPTVKRFKLRPFSRPLKALAQTVKAWRSEAHAAALKQVDASLSEALDGVRRFMVPMRRFTVMTAVEVLKVALDEYSTAIENGRFALPVEYQDSRGFVWEAEAMLEAIAPELEKMNPAALADIRTELRAIKLAWPAPMPPAAPVVTIEDISNRIDRIEELAKAYQ